MAQPYKLSLPSAVIINLNIMLGVGIFLNSVPFAQKAGTFSFLPYLIIGTLFIPLIIAMAVLINKTQDGSFYGIAKDELGSFWGFISTWAYFIAKPASAGLMIHFCCHLFQQLFPVLQHLSIFTLDTLVISVFVTLNLLNMRIGKSIQLSFLALKTIPILFIIVSGLWFIQPHNFAAMTFPTSGLISALPLAIYAFAGFEASLSLGKHIENAQKNAPRAIIISYLIVLVLFIIYQTCYYGTLNLDLLTQAQPFDAIAIFLKSISSTALLHIQALLYICMGTSALGGAYGILFSNLWNLHNLAASNHIPGAQIITQQNTNGIAYWCLCIEAAFCFGYVMLTHANQIILQQVNAFGCTLAYTVSMLAFTAFVFKKFTKLWARTIAVLALCSCSIFIISCVNGFYINGPRALYTFVALLIIGALGYRLSKVDSSATVG